MDRITKTMLIILLSAAVLAGGLIGFQRFMIENKKGTVELVMDYDDIRMLSSVSGVPMDKLLDDIRKSGVTSIGLREETPLEATALGEIYFARGSGVIRYDKHHPYITKLIGKGLIKPDRTYFIGFNPRVQKRISEQLKAMLPPEKIKHIGARVIEVDKGDIELQGLGIGFSETVTKYLKKKGFLIVPRLWSDPHYNVPEKIALLNGYPIVVFEGEEITGYPDDIALTAAALKKNNVRYGNIEIIKQDGDARLKALMGESVVRVHSVPRDELLKLNKEQTLDRFDRAVKERGIRMIYVRPFLPPQITEEPVSYNLNYVKEISQNILNSGYLLGTASAPSKLVPAGWQILLLGIGTIAVALLLLNAFVAVKWYWAWPFLVASLFVMLFVGAGSPGYPLEKGLALLAAIVFPAYAVVSNFGRKVPDNLHPLLFSLYIVANSVIDTVLGIFIIVGLLSNLDFMLTAQTFSGVKFALLIPVFLVAFYFFIKRSPDEHLGLRDIWGRVVETLDQNVKVFYVVMALAVLGALFVFVARSGNFSLPVPAAEKWFRTLLENSLTIRPRTKEFLVGYPFLFLSAYLLLKGKREWLWVTLSLGVIGLISLTNTFCHVHTPLSISVARSMNGMVLGAVVGFLLIWFINLLSRKKA